MPICSFPFHFLASSNSSSSTSRFLHHLLIRLRSLSSRRKDRLRPSHRLGPRRRFLDSTLESLERQRERGSTHSPSGRVSDRPNCTFFTSRRRRSNNERHGAECSGWMHRHCQPRLHSDGLDARGMRREHAEHAAGATSAAFPAWVIFLDEC